MNDIAYILIVLAVTLGSLFGIAFYMQKRSRASGNVVQAAPSRTDKIWTWYRRGIVVALIAPLICAYLFWDLTFVWITAGIIAVGMVIGLLSDLYHLIKLMSEK